MSQRRTGTPLERAMQRLDTTSTDCWLWLGPTFSNGYGQLPVQHGVVAVAHRFFYENLVGPIPEGLQLDHLCRVRNCVKPDHLEPVTIRENVHRSESSPGRNARKTHCDDGHEFTPQNTYITAQGGRRCRACRNAWSQRYKSARRANAAGAC